MQTIIYSKLAYNITFQMLWNGKGYFNDSYDENKKKAVCSICAAIAGLIVTVALNIIL